MVGQYKGSRPQFARCFVEQSTDITGSGCKGGLGVALWGTGRHAADRNDEDIGHVVIMPSANSGFPLAVPFWLPQSSMLTLLPGTFEIFLFCTARARHLRNLSFPPRAGHLRTIFSSNARRAPSKYFLSTARQRPSTSFSSTASFGPVLRQNWPLCVGWPFSG